MPRSVQFAIFITIMILITFGLHYYVWARLLRDPALPLFTRRILTGVLIFFLLFLISFMPLYRTIPRSISTVLGWITYGWMGFLLLLCLSLVGFDLIRLGIRLFSKPVDPERRLFLSQLTALGALGTGSILTGIAAFTALRKLRINEFSIKLAKLPRSFHGFRIVQLTDLHIGPTLGKEWVEHVVEKTMSLQPDLIAITGDLVDGSVAQLAEQVEPLRKLKAPYGIYFVTGNHEYYSGPDEWIEKVKSFGIQCLRNERVSITLPDGSSFDLAGVDDYHSGGYKGHGPDVKKALSNRDTSKALVLLAHQPAHIKEASEQGVDFQISGHTHGGQFWPWNYFVRLQQPYVVGLHHHPRPDGQMTQIYISPGTGFWGPPIRLGTRSEVTSIVLAT